MTKRKTHEEFIKDVFNAVGDEYSVIGVYKKTAEKLAMKHNTCGTIWEITPNNFLRGRRCPSCSHFKTTAQFSREVANSHEGQFILTGNYTNCDTKTSYKCSIHNTTVKSTPTIFMRTQYPCHKCLSIFLKESNRKSDSTFKQELEQRHSGSIISLDTYVNTHTHLRYKCLKCNKVFSAEPNSILRLSGCPYCASSKGEQYIKSVLEENDIMFVPQKRFDKCKDIRPLPFDFYLPNQKVLIEYDGKQHYAPIEYFGGIEKYKSQVKRDSIKDSFAKDNGYTLLRIPYSMKFQDVKIKLLEILN